MARIIPAFVHFSEDGDAAPKLIVSEGGSDLSDLISLHGLEVEEEDAHSHSDELERDDSDSGDAPKNGFRTCMSELLARPEGSGKLT